MVLSVQLQSLLLCKMHPMLQQFNLCHENVSLVTVFNASWFEKCILTFKRPPFAYAKAQKTPVKFHILGNNNVYYIFMSDYLPQNAIYFIILSLSCPIFLTFVINHVLKFKYQTSPIKDKWVFWRVRGWWFRIILVFVPQYMPVFIDHNVCEYDKSLALSFSQHVRHSFYLHLKLSIKSRWL